MMRDNTALIDEVLKKIPNKYLAVIVASKRARQINEDRAPLLKTGATKPTTMAMEEIALGLVRPIDKKSELKARIQSAAEVLPSSEDAQEEKTAEEEVKKTEEE